MWNWLQNQVVDKSQKDFQMHARKILHCYEGTAKGDSDQSPERQQKCCSESLSLVKENISGHKQNVGRNADSKGHSDETLDGKKEHTIELWRKGDSCYKVAKSLAELCLCHSIF